MCLAIPLKIIAVNSGVVVLENGNKVKIASIKDLKKDDYLLVQQGIALQKISPQEALSARRVLKGLIRLAKNSVPANGGIEFLSLIE